MNTLMPAPVAKPQIGEQAVEARLRAGAPLSSSRVHACESSLAGLPGLYSGRFLFCSSMKTWPGTSIPKSTRNAFDWLDQAALDFDACPRYARNSEWEAC